jgi:hypothetical protein
MEQEHGLTGASLSDRYAPTGSLHLPQAQAAGARLCGGGKKADSEMEVTADPETAALKRRHPASEVLADLLPGLGVGLELGFWPLAIGGDELGAAVVEQDVKRLGVGSGEANARLALAEVEGFGVEALGERA